MKLDFLPHGNLYGSKGQYVWDNPRNVVYFNANIYYVTTSKVTKLWYGDLDLTVEHERVQVVYKQCTKLFGKGSLYALPEMSGRFENETDPKFDDFIMKIDSDGVQWGDGIILENGRPYLASRPDVSDVPEEISNESDFELVFHFNFAKVKATKAKSPVDKYVELLIKEFGKEKASEISTGGYWSSQTEAKLKELSCTHMRSSGAMTEYQIEKAWNWTSFDILPQAINAPWAKLGAIYKKII